MRKLLITLAILLLAVAINAEMVDNQDATITDSSTSLIWQKAAGPSKNWSDAGTYCSSATIGGSSSWRLPTLSELLALVDTTYDLNLNPVFIMDPGGYTYWTDDDDIPDDILDNYVIKERAYLVYFVDGSTIHRPKLSAYKVRCVADCDSTWQGEIVTWQGECYTW